MANTVYITGMKVYLIQEHSDVTGTITPYNQFYRFQINQSLGNTSATVDGGLIEQFQIPDPANLGEWVAPTSFGTEGNVNACLTTPRDKCWDKKYNRVLDTGWKLLRPKFSPGIVNITGAPTFQYKYKKESFWIPINRTYELNNNGTVNGWRSWNFALFGTWVNANTTPDFSIKVAMYYKSGGSS